MLVECMYISERGIRCDAETAPATAPATVRWTRIEIATVRF